MTTTRFFLIAAAIAVASPALAQQASVTVASRDSAGRAAPPLATPPDTQPTKAKDQNRLPRYIAAPIEIQHMRASDQRGLNVFESPKEAGAAYTGFKLAIGGAFAQQFQNLTHQNAAALKPGKDASGKDVNLNALIPIGSGFNNAVANIYFNAQLARGIRVAVETYASARHHQEAGSRTATS